MKKKLIGMILLSAAAVFLTGCPGSRSTGSVASGSADYVVSEEAFDAESLQVNLAGNSSVSEAGAKQAARSADGSAGNEDAAAETKLIRTVSIDLKSETNNIEQVSAAIADRAAEFGGYAETNTVHVYDTRVEANLTIRIPEDRMDSYLEYIGSMGMKTTAKSDSVKDVTLEYTDLSSRIRVLETQRDKYISYLDNAQNVSEVLEIEERLTDVLAEIDSLQSSLNVLNNKVSYSTLNLTLTWTSAPAEGFSISLGDEITEALEELADSVASMIRFVIVAVPNAIFYIILLGLIWRFVRLVFGIKWTKPRIGERLKHAFGKRKKRKSDDHPSD